MREDGYNTYEITGTTKELRAEARKIVGVCLEWERLDNATWNASVPEDRVDALVEWAERENLQHRYI